MPWLIRAYVANVIFRRLPGCALLLALCQVAPAQQQLVRVPTGPPSQGKPLSFHDGKYGVRFTVPPGWKVSKKDREVSTFHLDARSATERTQLRAVASLDFNPYPLSVFSGALLYFSVGRHATDASCAAEATTIKDVQNIGGLNFAHGHDEHGGICVEARDEVYTTFRKGSCYRFDMAVNTFCSASSGAQDLTIAQMRTIEQKMADILSSVSFDWEGSGQHTVPVPEIVDTHRTDGGQNRRPARTPLVPQTAGL